MTVHDSDAVTALNDYWDTVVQDADTLARDDAAPPAGMDASVAAAVRSLHTHDDTPLADAAFAARLWQELMDQSRPRTVPGELHARGARHGPARRVRVGPWRPLALLGLAAALVVALAGSLSGLAPWAAHPSVASAQVILGKAQHAARSLTATPLSSVVITETMEAWPGASGLSALAGYTGTVRSTSTWWYSAPHHWRAEGQYLIAPHSPALIDGGALAAAPFAPFPGTVVGDGSTIQSYDPGTKTLRIVVLPHVGTNGIEMPFPLDVLLGQHASTLNTVLQQASTCYTPALRGSEIIAGRDAYRIDLGPSRCLEQSQSAYEASGRRVLWIDKQTYVVLQSDLYKAGDPTTLLTRTTVTGVQVNVALDAALFTFTPPPGTTVLDGSQRPAPQPIAPATPPTIASLRQTLPYPIFVPTDVPAGLTPQPPLVGDANHTPGVTLTYRAPDGSVALRVLNGPLGCCLDADYRKGGTLITLPRGITAHLISNEPQFGGPILWWDQDGAYVALSSPTLTQDALVKIAASMSNTADPRAG